MKELNIQTAPLGNMITDIEKYSAQFPGVVEQDGKLYVYYQKYSNRHDSLVVAAVDNDSCVSEEKELSLDGNVLYPKGISFAGNQYFAWSEYKENSWSLYVARTKGLEVIEIIPVIVGKDVLYPHFCEYNNSLYLLWTEESHNYSECFMCDITNGHVSEVQKISLENESYRANACAGGDGRLYVTYESYFDGAYHTMLRIYSNGIWSGEYKLSKGTQWVCEPIVIANSNGATVCWYSYDYGAEYQLQSADVSYAEGRVCINAPEVITATKGWYMNMTAASYNGEYQVLAYTWSKEQVEIRYRKAGGNWSKPSTMSYEDIHCAMYPSLLLKKDNIIMAWQFAYRNGHYDRNAAIVLTQFDFTDLDNRAKDVEASENTFCYPIPGEKSLDAHEREEVDAWLTKNGYKGQIIFGDIHGQSGISDGMGTIDQYYRRSRAKANLQLSCLTDHDCYPDWISESEWDLMKTVANNMNTDGELTCMLSYEWTPNEYNHDFGHKNVYYRNSVGDLFRACDDGGKSPTDLYESLRNYRGMCIPHHPAADWGMVSAGTDWNFHADDVERLAEIMSRHALYEDYEGQSKFTKNIKKFKNKSVQNALSRGYKLGFTAGSDSHQMDHGIEGGIVAVYADTHDREGIWDAMYARHTYGTTGARILLSFKANGHMMGDEIDVDHSKPVTFDISVLGFDNITVELKKNNEVIKTWTPNFKELDVSYSETDVAGTSYYYVKVTQEDTHMAWGSPIWINRK